MVDLAYILPETRAEAQAARAKAAGILESLSDLDYARRRPAIAVPSAAQMRAGLTQMVEPHLSGEVERLAARAVIEGLSAHTLPRIERSIRRHPEILQHVLWAFAQRDYANRVTGTAIESFVMTLPVTLATRYTQLVGERGQSWVNAHFAVAALTPTTLPTQLMFACGLVYQLGEDTLDMIVEVLHLTNRPAEVMVEALGALKQLLELAFASDEDGLARARQLGAALARGFSGSIENALFPDPMSRLGTAFFHPASRRALEEAMRLPGADVAREVASLVMIPFELGALLGPILLDLLMAILGLVVPGLEEIVLARAGRYLRRVMGIADDLIDAARLTQKLDRLTPDLPNPRGTGHGPRLAGGAQRGLPDAAREVDRGIPDAPPAPALSPRPAETPPPASPTRPPRPSGPAAPFRGLSRELREFLGDEHRIDVGDAYTSQYLDRIFARQRGENLVSGTEASLVLARADAAELWELTRHGRRGHRGGDDLDWIRFLRPRRGGQTPDLLQLWRTRQPSRFHVEVTTMTQAQQGELVRSRVPRRREPVVWHRSQLKDKIEHGQINRDRQGSIVFRTPQVDVATMLPQMQAHITEISRTSVAMREGWIHRIEFTGHTRHVLVFENGLWRAALVPR